MSLEDDLTEEEYEKLLRIRNRVSIRRRDIQNGETVFNYDPDYDLSQLSTRPLGFMEYEDGEVYPVVSRYTPCKAQSGISHTTSPARKNWCIHCKHSLN
jgi:hypothetical protein